MVDYKTFASRIKEKHPDYAQVPDIDLTYRVLDKHPQYRGVVDMDTIPNPFKANEMLNNGIMYNASEEQSRIVNESLGKEGLAREEYRLYTKYKTGVLMDDASLEANRELEYPGMSYESANQLNGVAAKEQRNLMDSIKETFVRRTAGGFAQIPQYLEDVKKLDDKITEEIYAWVGVDRSRIGDVQKQLDEIRSPVVSEELRVKMSEWGKQELETAGEIQSEFMSGKPLGKSFKEGDWESVGNDIGTAIAFELPNLATQMMIFVLSGGSSAIAYMVGASAMQKRGELGEDVSLERKVFDPALTGAIEGLTEKYLGTGRVIDRMAKDKVKKAATSRIIEGAKDLSGGFTSEAGATFGGNVINKAFGDDVDLREGVLLSGIVGSLMDFGAGQLTMPMTLGDATRIRKQNSNEQIDAMVEEGTLTPEQGVAAKTPTQETVGEANNALFEAEGVSAPEPEEITLGEGFVKEKAPEVVDAAGVQEQGQAEEVQEVDPRTMSKEEWVERLRSAEVYHQPFNRTDAPYRGNFVEGEFLVEKYGDDPYIYRAEFVNPKELIGNLNLEGNTYEQVVNKPTTQKYIEWYKQGEMPPAIDVVRTDNGNLRSTNRRRVIAAIEAGVDKIPALVEVGKKSEPHVVDSINKYLANNAIDVNRTGKTRAQLEAEWEAAQVEQPQQGVVEGVQEEEIAGAPVADEAPAVAEPTGYMTDAETMDDVANITRSRSRVQSKLLTPVLEVIGDVSPKLKTRVTRWEFDTHKRKKNYTDKSKEFLDSALELSKSDKHKFTQAQLALKNGDFDRAESILGKDVVDQIRNRTDQLADDLNSVGYDFERRENYFPRRVKDLKGLRNALGKEAQSVIDDAIAEQQRKAEANGYVLSDMEIEKIINNVINGSYRPVGGRKPKSMKQRTIEEITPELDVFYYDAIESWLMHNNEVADIVELRRLLGKDIKIDGDVVDMNESIGAVVDDVIKTEGLSEEDANRLIGALRARLGYRATGKAGQNYRSMVAMTTLGQYSSALTQLGDFTWSFYENGLFDTLGGAKDVLGKSGVTMQDLGIDEISAEFRTPNGLMSAVDTLFKYSGLKAMDKLGKETLVNASLREYQAGAETGVFSQDKQDKLDALFGAEQDSVIEDLKNGKMSDDVELLLFSTVLDWHPTTLSNMPIAYLENPNGRLLYVLKTFTVKQLDNFRRVAVDDLIEGIATKDMSLASRGFGRMMKLAGIMLAANVPIDMLKDWITGKEVSFSDSLLDNIFKLFGASRYNAMRAQRKGQKVTESIFRELFPPAPFFDYPMEDAKYIRDQLQKGEDIDMMNLESWNMVPFIGRTVYWRYGKGKEKLEKRRKQK